MKLYGLALVRCLDSVYRSVAVKGIPVAFFITFCGFNFKLLISSFNSERVRAFSHFYDLRRPNLISDQGARNLSQMNLLINVPNILNN